MFSMIKVASRFLIKHRAYMAINVIGLSLSLVCAIFIGLFIYDELSFDHLHTKRDQIYRVIEHKKSEDGSISKLADVGFRIGSLQDRFPEIELAVRITTFGRAHFSVPGTDRRVNDPFHITDQGFMEMFDFPILYGRREDALTNPNTAVITRSAAIKLFGKAEVVDQTILNDREGQLFKITAVLEDFPLNSHIQGNMFFSMETFASAPWYIESLPNDWNGNDFATYLLLQQGTDAPALATTITEEVQKHLAAGSKVSAFTLQPMRDVHFQSADIRGGFASNPGQIYYLYMFGAVGLFILVIACINYVNLSTSLSITRGKEVGVKKVAGASKLNLIIQFIAESNMICLLALVVALVLVNVLLPFFNDFAGKDLRMSTLWTMEVMFVIVGFTLLTGTLSGCYPAFFLSSLKPSAAIKGARVGAKSTMRQGLVVLQFGLAVMLMLATFVSWQQLNFIRDKNLGFAHDQLVVIDINSGDVRRNAEVIKTEMEKLPAVTSVSITSRVPGEWKTLLQVGAKTLEGPVQEKMHFMGVDEDFLRTFKIEMAAGRNFQAGNVSDTSAFIINETAAKMLGMDSPLGAELILESVSVRARDEALARPVTGKIIGIVKDFHFQSLHQRIAPMILAHKQNNVQAIDYFTVRLSGSNMAASLSGLGAALQKVDAGHVFEYNFLDDRLGDFYRKDTLHGQIFGLAATVAIALACLGLFSLASFMTEQRTKEIGIRKVLGATATQIVIMLSASYVRLVAIGFLIATPVALWLLGKWLQSFAYHINIGWQIILMTCGLSVLIALITVGYKSLATAVANPVKSLRNE